MRQLDNEFATRVVLSANAISIKPCSLGPRDRFTRYKHFNAAPYVKKWLLTPNENLTVFALILNLRMLGKAILKDKDTSDFISRAPKPY